MENDNVRRMVSYLPQCFLLAVPGSWSWNGTLGLEILVLASISSQPSRLIGLLGLEELSAVAT